MRTWQVTFAAVAFGFVAPQISQADMYPIADAYGDASRVDLIVEARWTGGDRVAVVRTLFAVEPPASEIRELIVEGLSRHDRGIDSGPTPTRETTDVILLLDRTDIPRTWRPHGLILESDTRQRSTGGAAGTYWLKDDAVWAYTQPINPGPFVLRPWTSSEGAHGTPRRLREEIAAGIAARREWEADLATPDAADRARRLVRWLWPATSPDGARRAPRRYAVRGELVTIGKPAVPALVGALDPEGEGEAKEEALLAIADLRSAAHDATPRLLEVARAPGGAPPHAIAYALRYAGDERAIQPLRDLLAAASLGDVELLRHSAHGLVEHRDPEAVTRVASRLPPSPDGLKSPYGVLELLEALQRVDRARARSWIVPWASHPLFAHSRERLARVLKD